MCHCIGLNPLRRKSLKKLLDKPFSLCLQLNYTYYTYFQKWIARGGRHRSHVSFVLRWSHPPPTSAAMWGITSPEYLAGRSWSRDLGLHHVWHNEALHWKKMHYNIMEPFELKMYLCVLCAAKFRSMKEQDKHNRVEHVGERAFPCSHVKRVHSRAAERWERWERVPSQFEILAAILADDLRTFVAK